MTEPSHEKQRILISFFVHDKLFLNTTVSIEEIIQERNRSEKSFPACSCCEWNTEKTEINSADIEATKKIHGKQFRFFNEKWIIDYPWIHLPDSKKKLFCYICIGAVKKNIESSSKCREQNFSTIGYEI